ncbi:hypothetical protein KO317_03355 [Candidatus Micrarchaeota archaeon]|nr:hypothetical protein [Candidatus Micrarchaeota archaeon]
MNMRCERCSAVVHKIEKCNYCDRKICHSCAKSSRKDNTGTRRLICKDCWGEVKKRKAYQTD